MHKGRDELRVEEVDEAVAHIAPVLEVDGQVEEVVCPLVVEVDLFQQHLLVVFVGDVAHHDGGSALLVLADAGQVQGEVGVDIIIGQVRMGMVGVVGGGRRLAVERGGVCGGRRPAVASSSIMGRNRVVRHCSRGKGMSAVVVVWPLVGIRGERPE